MLDGSYFFECQCCSDEHTLRFTLDKDEDELLPTPCIYTSVFLQHEYSFFKRVWNAITYVLGRTQHKYGHFDCFLMQPEDVVKFQAMLREFSGQDDDAFIKHKLFFEEICTLTIKHDVVELRDRDKDGMGSVAVVYPDKLGVALSKIDRNWHQ